MLCKCGLESQYSKEKKNNNNKQYEFPALKVKLSLNKCVIFFLAIISWNTMIFNNNLTFTIKNISIIVYVYNNKIPHTTETTRINNVLVLMLQYHIEQLLY